MNKNMIFDAMEYIDDAMLEEVDALRCRRAERPVRTWARSLACAACLCAVMGSLLLYARYADGVAAEMDGANKFPSYGIEGGHDAPDGEGGCAEDSFTADTEMSAPSADEGTANGVTVPKTKIPSVGTESADMVPLFVWDGRVYAFYQVVSGHPELAGAYLGTASCEIDEWTDTDAYVDFSGTVSGRFYTVNGYDPSFMLCMKAEDGALTLFVNDNGITLHTGYDLFEHRLHVSGNYKAVQYLVSEKQYDAGQGKIKTLYSASRFWTAGVVKRFVKAMNDGEFLYADDVLPSGGASCLYRMLFCMENGTTVFLRLYEGGYVQCEALWSVCVKIDAAVFDELLASLS
ncbi:MAG: hypothetical protein J6S76_02175 [Clostridia bacterium]|nr:hypothetical protein [Clostridia bacterium]